MVNRVILTGPESTGKTTLAEILGKEFHCDVVSEIARTYLTERGETYQYKDVELMARAQQFAEDSAGVSNRMLIIDTDQINFAVWMFKKYGSIFNQVEDRIKRYRDENRLYLLCYPDLPWQEDPLRESKNERLEIFYLHKQLLDDFKLNYCVIKGIGSDRTEQAKKMVGEFFNF